MMKYVIILSLFFCSNFGHASSVSGKVDCLAMIVPHVNAQGLPKYPKPKGFVSDFEGIFTPDEIEQLTALIVDFEKRTTVQIAIVTLDDRYTAPERFDDYTLGLANRWGVGQKGKDNGVMIALSMQFGQMRIHNGLGIEKVFNDEETKQLIDDYFINDYSKGLYFEGTLAGLKALIKILESKDLPD